MTDQEIQEYLLRKASETYSPEYRLRLCEELMMPLNEFFKNTEELLKLALIAQMVADCGRKFLVPLVVEEFRKANPETAKKKMKDVY